MRTPYFCFIFIVLSATWLYADANKLTCKFGNDGMSATDTDSLHFKDIVFDFSDSDREIRRGTVSACGRFEAQVNIKKGVINNLTGISYQIKILDHVTELYRYVAGFTKTNGSEKPAFFIYSILPFLFHGEIVQLSIKVDCR